MWVKLTLLSDIPREGLNSPKVGIYMYDISVRYSDSVFLWILMF